jgi:membrane-bound lytic murein transglycosylase D
MRLFAALFFAAIFPVAAQTREVPHKMEFAGMTLTIRDDARREIQKDVDALTLSPKHYNIKAERAKTYFPLMEKIFQEENVPDDFKFLALQESALTADAVSSSNAVGFWQFKDFTAIEMGLRVDKEIDERLNIASSTRAAARYIKKNNVFFNNWLYALQAYQMGAGGVLKSVKDSQSGVTHMEITSQTYWYVKKYLAHKIAYEEGVKGKGQVEVLIYENKNKKTLSALAQETAVDETELKNYNKWTKSGNIPDDRTYVVVIPVISGLTPNISPALTATIPISKSQTTAGNASASVTMKINGLMAMKAVAGDNAVKFADRAGIDIARFLKWNDLKPQDQIVAGNYYFTSRKRGRASESFHKLLPGENLWIISQKYGVQLRKLRKYNRLSSGSEPVAGTMLWLASTRPKDDKTFKPVENAIVVEEGETFNWSISPDDKTGSVTTTSQPVTIVPPVKDTLKMELTPSSNSVDSSKNLQPINEVVTIADTLENIEVKIPQVLKTEHLVQAGETLYGIAKIYQLGVMDLVNWNNLDLQQGIKPGQILKLFDSQTIRKEVVAVKTPREISHEVKASDTLYSIARQYGVTIKDLMDWNAKKDFSLSVGEKLKVIQVQ